MAFRTMIFLMVALQLSLMSAKRTNTNNNLVLDTENAGSTEEVQDTPQHPSMAANADKICTDRISEAGAAVSAHNGALQEERVRKDTDAKKYQKKYDELEAAKNKQQVLRRAKEQTEKGTRLQAENARWEKYQHAATTAQHRIDNQSVQVANAEEVFAKAQQALTDAMELKKKYEVMQRSEAHAEKDRLKSAKTEETAAVKLAAADVKSYQTQYVADLKALKTGDGQTESAKAHQSAQQIKVIKLAADKKKLSKSEQKSCKRLLQ